MEMETIEEQSKCGEYWKRARGVAAPNGRRIYHFSMSPKGVGYGVKPHSGPKDPHKKCRCQQMQKIKWNKNDYKYILVCICVTKKATASCRRYFNLFFWIYFGVENIYRINAKCLPLFIIVSPHSPSLRRHCTDSKKNNNNWGALTVVRVKRKDTQQQFKRSVPVIIDANSAVFSHGVVAIK